MIVQSIARNSSICAIRKNFVERTMLAPEYVLFGRRGRGRTAGQTPVNSSRKVGGANNTIHSRKCAGHFSRPNQFACTHI